MLVALMAVPVVGDDDEPSARVDSSGLTASEEATRASTVEGGASAEVTTSSTTATTAAAGGSVAEGASSVPTTSAPPATTATTAEDLGPPQDPGPAVPPRAGLYRYRVTTSEGEEEAPTRVEDKGRPGDETRLAVTITGQGLTGTSDVSWKPDGVRNLRSKFTFGATTADCDWEPDVLEHAFPLRAGATWSSESTCTVTFGATPVVVKRTVRAEVVDLRRVRVDGQVVDVWAIRRVEQLSGAGQSGETQALVLFSPKHGIDVEVTGTVSGGGGGGEYHQTLVHLDPEA
jgi:hypothetical protein